MRTLQRLFSGRVVYRGGRIGLGSIAYHICFGTTKGDTLLCYSYLHVRV